MKISTKGRYALRMMIDIAENQHKGYVALKDIAIRQDISKKYLEQIALHLSQCGMLRAVRGYQGGYMLSRDARDYTVTEILSAVEEIPPGRVASYGQIARLIGRPRNARLVGKALSMAERYGDYPCHWVVNHAGRLAPGFTEQEQRLREEGVAFLPDGRVDMARCRWVC